MCILYILTVSGHADGEALPESAELTAIPVQSYHQALAVPQAPVLDLLLYAPPEEALQRKENVLYSYNRVRVVL